MLQTVYKFIVATIYAHREEWISDISVPLDAFDLFIDPCDYACIVIGYLTR